MSLNGFAIPQASLSYIDGFVHGATGGGGFAKYVFKQQLDQPSVNSPLPFSEIDFQLAGSTNTAFKDANLMPGLYQNTGCIQALVSDIHVQDYYPLFLRPYLPPVVGNASLGGVIGVPFGQPGNIGTRIPLPNVYNCDNAIIFGTSPTYPTHRIVKYNSSNVSIQSVDNIILPPVNGYAFDTIFQNTSSLSAWHGGFMSILNTMGAGPTGQLNEVLVFTPDAAGFYLLDFQPQDALSAQQLSTNGGWQVKIDAQGIVWMYSGSLIMQHHVSYSFSTGFNFPVLYFGNLQPITLPCWIGSLPGTLYSTAKG